MATSSVTAQKTAVAKPVEKLEKAKPSRNYVAVLLNPSCQHDWSKLSNEHQTLGFEGKTIWQCRTCDEVTTTYDWQAPGE